MKVCTRCKEDKDLEDFYRSTQSPDGLHWWCKECMSDFAAQKRRRKNALLRIKDEFSQEILRRQHGRRLASAFRQKLIAEKGLAVVEALEGER